jgi:hypothetical protein
MNENYPPGVFKLPDDGVEEQEYIFEIHGEITVDAYSEEDAEDVLENNLRDLLVDAYYNGDIEIR